MKLDDKVWQEGIKKSFWQTGDKILVACSGGVDSMVLLEIFNLWSQRKKVQVFAIHCNHQLRGEESENDAKMVEEWCTGKNIPLKIERLPVIEYQRDRGGNLEEIARDLRYQAIQKVADEIQVDIVVLGHHQDDQAETVLLHLFRGSGYFKGMKEKRGDFIRPLLSFSKDEIYQFAKEQKIPYWEDSSNQDQDFRRNWIRAELLPLLEEKIQPEIKSVLGRWAILANDEEEFWQKYCQNWCQEFCQKEERGFSIPVNQFNQLTLGESRRIIRTILLMIRGNLRGIEFAHVESIISLARKNVGKSSTDISGDWCIRVFHSKLYIERGN